MRNKTIAKGEFIYRKGDPAAALYIVKSGSFRLIESLPNGSEIRSPEIFSGHIIGELSLFDGERRESSVQASQDSEVQEIRYETLLGQRDDLPQWAEIVMKAMVEHMRIAIKYIRSHHANK